MTEYPNSHLVPFLGSSSASNMLALGDHELAESPHLFDFPVDYFFDDFPSNTEVPSRRIVLTTNHHNPNPKVPISRMSTPISWNNRARVSQACKACRQLKTKCSGQRPVCQRCEDLGLDCNYSERKREVVNKKMEDLSAHIDKLENLLRDVYPKLDSTSAQHVDRTLNNVSLTFPRFDFVYILSLDQLISAGFSDFLSDDVQGLSHDRARLNLRPPAAERSNTPKAPPTTFGHTDEDFNRSGELQALGFVGEHSEMAWLYRIKSALEQASTTPSTSQETTSRPSIASINYYIADWRMEVQDEVSVFERPEKSEADQLIDTYFRIIHPSFPVVGKMTFLGQYKLFYADTTARPRKQWLAILNFMFAIAGMHLSPTQNITECDEFSHRVFFSRGWILMGKSIGPDIPPSDSIFPRTSLLTNLSHRSWKCCGIAICSALAMGLNLRNESQIVAPLSKEIRYRVWWSLYVLDTSLAGITGRPSRINEAFCTTPPPVPFEEGDLNVRLAQKDFNENKDLTQSALNFFNDVGRSSLKNDQDKDGLLGRSVSRCQLLSTETIVLSIPESPQPSDSLSFSYGVELTILMREAIDKIYAPGTTHKQWVEVERMIASFNTKANTWLASLPASYQFQKISENRPLRHQLSRVALQFYSVKLVITQPCLQRILHSITTASDASEEVSDPMTETCIRAAGQLLDLLPDEPNLTWLHGVVPWWCALHYLMQTITINLTELFLRTKAGTNENIAISMKLEKALAWLKTLSKVNISAQKAWLISSDIISHQGLKLGSAA
ncbi:uncharacterized protein N7511_003539 [Penicillium nucicola]|uniref:uncharacterized protein n=1 Tax=Penicillium nucicola TaxID=1850975 RepID=UPI002545BAD5|nr:uncharacterized protein N7511_003539 [Penicillium nucicola]KAJ5771488.1 hypothetical protein N7511_003539 [Penicillium nucicola]